MIQSGSYSLSPVSENQSQLVPMAIRNPDAYNPIIRAGQITYNIELSGISNGTLNIYDLVFKDPLSGGENPSQVISVVDGQISGSSSYSVTLPVKAFQTQEFSAITWVPSENSVNSGSVGVSWEAYYAFPTVIPSSGVPFNYVDLNTGHLVPLFIVYSDHVDFLGKSLTNMS